MLIGNDYYFDLLEPQKLDLGGKLFLFNSELGWILGGQTENTYARKTTVSSLLASTVGTVSVGTETTTPMFSNTDLSLACKPDLELFWNLESIGIMDSPKMCDDDQALENFQKMIRHMRTTGTLSLGRGRIQIHYYLITISLLPADLSLYLADYRRILSCFNHMQQ